MKFFSLFLLLAGAATAQNLSPATQLAQSATQIPLPETSQGSESPLYVKAYGFYGLLTPGARTTAQFGGTNAAFKVNKKGLGAGGRAGAGVGMIINDFLNAGIDADWLFGSSIKTTSARGVITLPGSGTPSSSARSESTLDYQVLTITPNVTFKALAQPVYHLYTRLGLSVGFLKNHTTASSTNSEVTAITTLKSKPGVGFQAAVGFQFRLSPKLRGFAELVSHNLTFRPNQSVMEQSSGKKTIIDYLDEGVQRTETQGNITFQTRSRESLPVNGIGVGVGLLLRL